MVLADPRPPTVHPDRPSLPQARGPISRWLLDLLIQAPVADPAVTYAGHGRDQPPLTVESITDPMSDGDVQLALHVIHELSYRGFDVVDDRWEWDERVVALRRSLEHEFEQALRRRVDERNLISSAGTVGDVIARFSGPSLSLHMARHGTLEELREFAVHRSAYQLKEADPHSRGIPRFSGPRKAALIEIQADEYGNGRPGEAHADLFAAVLRGLDLDPTYGAYLDRLPAATLATGNLVSMLGGQHRLRAALLGHLAAFELTSVRPMTRYATAAVRLGLGDDVRRFYEVHIAADEHHGALSADVLVGGDPEAEGLARSEICFGAAALMVVEDQFTRALLRAWAADQSSLLPPTGDADR